MTKKPYEQRLIFRTTKEQTERVDKIADSDNYRTRSNVLRKILKIGIEKLEKEIKND
jgi:metal-responsive CopG/Arc/MetJ family transcriptional regulator